MCNPAELFDAPVLSFVPEKHAAMVRQMMELAALSDVSVTRTRWRRCAGW